MPRGITYEQVAAAADRIVASGDDPTLRSVREALGTGSLATIHRYMRAWSQARPQLSTPPPIQLPDTIVKAIGQEIARAGAEARAEAEALLAQTQDDAAALEKAGEDLEEERGTLLEQVRDLTTQRDVLKGRAEELSIEVNRFTTEIEKERHSAEQSRADVLRHVNTIEVQRKQIENQRTEIEELNKDRNDEHHARVVAERNGAVIEAKLDASQRETKEARIEVERLNGEVRRLIALNEVETKTRSASEQSVAVMSAQLEESRREIERTTTEIERERRAAVREREQADAHLKAAAEARAEVAALKAQMGGQKKASK